VKEPEFERRLVVNPKFTDNRTPKDPFRDMYARAKPEKKRVSFVAGIARFVLLICIGMAAGAAGVATQGYIFFTTDLPSIEKLKKYTPPTVTQFYANKGELIAEFASQRRFIVSSEEIPEIVQNAFISAEDKKFREHDGIDVQAIIRAFKTNIMNPGAKPVGASTITQQVAKVFLLTPAPTIIRKIREAILATRMERLFTNTFGSKKEAKKHILYLYLNEINFGSAWGVEAAAQAYFDKGVKDLSIAECALLAGIPKGPSIYSPKKNLEKSVERRNYVLKRMLEDGYLTEAQYEASVQEKPQISTKQITPVKAAPDFVEHVRKYVAEKYGNDALYKHGLQVYTTVDLNLTKTAEHAVDEGLRELDKREGYRGPIRTMNVKSMMDFLEEKTRSMKGPLRFGQVTDGVVTQIDAENIYVHLGSYIQGNNKREYVGQIKIDPNTKWWPRLPFIRPEMRTRNFGNGDLPFQVGDLIEVRIIDPNQRRKELYLKKYGKTDPEFKNYKEYTEDMLTFFPLELEQEPIAQSALMFRENRTGHVKVMIGGNSPDSKYNRATQARRQAGSSFKPVIYAAALNKGFTCADIILDSPLHLTIPGTGTVWSPKNYRGGFAGPVTFRDSLVKSRNIPTIRILQQIGLEHAKAYARKLGYTSPLVDNLTMALGSTGVSLEDQVNAFAVFPNRGYYVPNTYVTRIVDRNGKALEEHQPPVLLNDPAPSDLPEVRKISHVARPAQTLDNNLPDKGSPLVSRRIDEETAYIMSSILQGVITEGTATNLKKIVNRPDLAGKTGTTNENVDAWFVGFSPDFTCGVWVGFDDEVSLGDQETGGKAAAPIWGYFMRQALKDAPIKEFQQPANVVIRKIDPRTGLLTSSPEGVQEIFKGGNGPAEVEPKFKGSRWDYSGSDLDQF
jgi:penicillin-binding protein 1A